jgi:hypothetical protein
VKLALARIRHAAGRGDRRARGAGAAALIWTSWRRGAASLVTLIVLASPGSIVSIENRAVKWAISDEISAGGDATHDIREPK